MGLNLKGYAVAYGALWAAFNNPLWDDQKGAADALQNNANFTDVKVGGYKFFACDTVWATGFNAKASDGRTVEGAVCRPLFNSGSYISTFENKR